MRTPPISWTSRRASRMSCGGGMRTTCSRRRMDPLDQKLLDCFPGKVVRKDLVAPLRNEYHVPSYVVEFLLGRYCSSQDDEVIQAGLAEVQRTLTEHFVRSEKAPEIQAIL